jgi:hypothetical protein
MKVRFKILKTSHQLTGESTLLEVEAKSMKGAEKMALRIAEEARDVVWQYCDEDKREPRFDFFISEFEVLEDE